MPNRFAFLGLLFVLCLIGFVAFHVSHHSGLATLFGSLLVILLALVSAAPLGSVRQSSLLAARALKVGGVVLVVAGALGFRSLVRRVAGGDEAARLGVFVSAAALLLGAMVLLLAFRLRESR